jgi:hypothetical protein
MLSFIEPSLAEMLRASLRDLIADAIPRWPPSASRWRSAAVVLARVRTRSGEGAPQPLRATV